MLPKAAPAKAPDPAKAQDVVSEGRGIPKENVGENEGGVGGRLLGSG
jgi:hypothetical protein